ncbi:LysR family transcriptional regulator [Hoeflea sp. WL0058]|uniref:LysR family transcriptional regulator n=1 Tax=Flavimaribacter sediminis TaxID=2865987 RepID=A0AAE2ZN16_9HYPH|nr:LysR family transcriptional regulator [Flavimaribacter sediminis]MBW8638939.1 LysR family transcriptional regulator [Flavimaribacter sediminis]
MHIIKCIYLYMALNDLELLRPATVFATVVDEGSFRAAADRLGLSAPYVSQLVADLENRLGRQLLYRSTRKIALSADGERFLPVAQQIAGALREGLNAFRSENTDLVGQLRLSLPSVLASPFFARLLTEFQSKHPRLGLEAILDDEAVDPMDRQTDLTIRIGDPGDDRRPAKLLFRTRGVVCVSASNTHWVKTPKDLKAMRWIKTPAMGVTLKLSKPGKSRPVQIEPDSSMITNNGQLTAQLVSEGMGWAIFPEFAVREAISSEQMSRALPDWEVLDVGVYALYSARQSSLSNAKALVDFIAEKLVQPTFNPSS